MTGDGPASRGQAQLWLAEQAAPEQPANNVPAAWHLYGPLDPDALRTALARLVTRHVVLRTLLNAGDAGVRQVVTPARPVPVVPLPPDPPGPARDPVPLPASVDDFVHEPFDLNAQWPLRVGLVRFGPEHHLLVLVLHHVVHDSLSTAILRTELVAAYEAALADPDGAPPEPDDGYLTFAAAEEARWAADEPYARRWLDGLDEAAREHRHLPGGAGRRLVGPAVTHEYALPVDATGRLLERAAAEGCTAPMAFCAVFAAVLGRWTGERRAVFSMPVSTRSDPRFDHTLGFFVNSMPVVVQVGDAPPVPELFARARSALLAALDHAHVPQDEVRAALSGASGDPLHDVTLLVEQARPERFTMGGLSAVAQPVPARHTMFGLSVTVWLDAGACRITVTHDSDAISVDVATRLAGHFREAVDAAGAGRLLPDLPDRDRALVLRRAAGPAGGTAPGLLDRVAAHARNRPDAPAVRYAGATLSYADLWNRAGRWAARLGALGLGPDDVVGVCQPRTADLLVSVLGILRAGAAFMPLDPRDPPARRDMLLRRSGAGALLAVPPGDDRVRLVVAGTPVPEPGAVPPACPGRPDDPDTLAYVINTSGSTGVPKGVQVTRRNLANYLRWATGAYGLYPDCEVPLHTSVAFDLAITSLLGPLYAGGLVDVLAEERGPLAVAEDLRHGYQLVKGTPSHLVAMVDEIAVRPPGIGPVVLAIGGENLPAEHVRRWLRSAPASTVVNEYGPTETTVASVAYPVPGAPSGDVVPIGVPIDGTTVYVVDRNLRLVPVGVRGELLIGGAGLARGYRGAPGLTAERFVPDPFGPPGGRLYRTGDVAAWNADGVLELVGRLDDQVKVIGYRVEPGEIEGVLATVPGVRHSAVLADRIDAQRVRLVAFVCPDGADPDGTLPARARDQLSSRLPAHMVPEAFVLLDRLPGTGNGKVDRAALRAALPEPAPEPGPADPGGWHEKVRAAWREVLGRDDVPGDVSFFAAGGTSLMLLRLNTALHNHGVTGFSVTDLFRHRTIDAFAAHLGGGH